METSSSTPISTDSSRNPLRRGRRLAAIVHLQIFVRVGQVLSQDSPGRAVGAHIGQGSVQRGIQPAVIVQGKGHAQPHHLQRLVQDAVLDAEIRHELQIEVSWAATASA